MENITIKLKYDASIWVGGGREILCSQGVTDCHLFDLELVQAACP